MTSSIILKLFNEIKEKQYLLDDHIKKYNWDHLIRLISIEDKNSYLRTIKKITFEFQTSQNWKIAYIHETNHYNTSNYCLNDSSEDELRNRNVDGLETTKIAFGYTDGSYFIKTKNEEIKVYMPKGIPYVYNSDYEYEIGVFGEDVDDLMKKYSYNYNIPEWLAISCFLKIREKRMSSVDIYNYFTSWKVVK